MSGRCKACNAVMTEDEMKTKYMDSNEYVELCTFCLREDDFDDDPEWFDLEEFNEDEL